MPKLWSDSIDAHRRDVREAILDAAGTLVVQRGLRAVTMSKVAEDAGIGRATLYKYFPDVESLLAAWHERQIVGHLEQLILVSRHAGDAAERLAAVLEAYALIAHEHRGHEKHDAELVVLLHRGAHVTRAQSRLTELLRDLLADAAASGAVRDDVSPAELATYCLYALAAAGGSTSRAAVRRLVAVTLAGLQREG